MTNEERNIQEMVQWDKWRDYIATGGKGSWPRDEFEMLVAGFEEEISKLREELKARIADRDRMGEIMGGVIDQLDAELSYLQGEQKDGGYMSLKSVE